MTYGTSPHRKDTVRQAAQARRMSKNMLAVIAQLAEFGDHDPLTAGSVVTWDMAYDYHGKVYSFAAIKADNGRYYLTGQETTGRTWDEMVEFWVTYNVTPDDVDVVASTRTVGDLIDERDAILEALK